MSQLENCPVCQNPTSENASLCPSCGEPFEPGWAAVIREKRKTEEVEELRLENEELDRQNQVRIDTVLARNKAKKKKFKIWMTVAVVLLAILFVPGLYDDYQMENLKNSNPDAYQKIVDQKLQKERQMKVDKLEAEVAKVPASNYDKNLSIYKKLTAIDPENKKYISKIGLYNKKKKDALLMRKQALEKAKEIDRQNQLIIKKNFTGIWAIGKYVDGFGEPTSQKYITNTRYIRGTFSNTATQDSELNVKFLINSSSRIYIMLYEYAGSNPVKAYSNDEYIVMVQDSSGARITFNVENNSSDRITFNGDDALTLHKILLKEGTVKFRITEFDTPTTNYSFNIVSADGYKNAYSRLAKK